MIAYDVHSGRAAGFAGQVGQLLPGATVTVTDGPEAAVRGADATIARNIAISLPRLATGGHSALNMEP